MPLPYETDSTGNKLQIYSVEERDATAAVCIVRCVGGIVRAGQKFKFDSPADAAGDVTHMTLDWINQYQRPVDFIGPPHSAKVQLSGNAVAALEKRVVITAIIEEGDGHIDT